MKRQWLLQEEERTKERKKKGVTAESGRAENERRSIKNRHIRYYIASPYNRHTHNHRSSHILYRPSPFFYFSFLVMIHQSSCFHGIYSNIYHIFARADIASHHVQHIGLYKYYNIYYPSRHYSIDNAQSCFVCLFFFLFENSNNFLLITVCIISFICVFSFFFNWNNSRWPMKIEKTTTYVAVQQLCIARQRKKNLQKKRRSLRYYY